MLKTKLAKDIIAKRKEELKIKQRKDLIRAYQKELIETHKMWKEVRPRISSLNSQMTSLLNETEGLVKFLIEPLYLVEIKDTKELKICRASELKKAEDDRHS